MLQQQQLGEPNSPKGAAKDGLQHHSRPRGSASDLGRLSTEEHGLADATPSNIERLTQ